MSPTWAAWISSRSGASASGPDHDDLATPHDRPSRRRAGAGWPRQQEQVELETIGLQVLSHRERAHKEDGLIAWTASPALSSSWRIHM